jgi:hypothetical protein
MEICSDKTCDVAILLFGFSAEVESRRKCITGSRKRNFALWNGLHEKTVALLKGAGFPYFIYDEYNQNGATFGERISNATDAVFELGYEKVIILGNDCPELSASHLNRTLHAFENNDVVLGCDKRGGACLIGISRSVFDKAGFGAMQWQTAHVSSDLLKLAHPERSRVIAYLVDINVFSDVLLLPLHTIIKKLRNLLLSIFSFINLLCAEYQYDININNHLYNNRGSPSCA